MADTQQSERTQQESGQLYGGPERRSQESVNADFWKQAIGETGQQTDYAGVLAQRALFQQVQQHLQISQMAVQQAQAVAEVSEIQRMEQRIEQNVLRKIANKVDPALLTQPSQSRQQ